MVWRKELPVSKEYAHIQCPPTSGGHQPLHLSLKVDQLPVRRQCDRLCVRGVVRTGRVCARVVPIAELTSLCFTLLSFLDAY